MSTQVLRSAFFIFLFVLRTSVIGIGAYEISWSVNDPSSANNYGQSETRNAFETRGQYFVQLPDGRIQTVTYRVDKNSGFVAQISYSFPVSTTVVVPGAPDYVTGTGGATPVPQPGYGGPPGPVVQPDPEPRPPALPDYPDPVYDIPPRTPSVPDIPDPPLFVPDAPPDYPGGFGADFPPPDYPTDGESGGGGGLFGGEEVVRVPDPITASFFPGANRPDNFAGIGIQFPGESPPSTGGNSILFPSDGAAPEPPIFTPLDPAPAPLPAPSDGAGLGGLLNSLNAGGAAPDDPSGLSALLNFFQNNNAGNDEDNNPLGPTDPNYDSAFEPPPQFIPVGDSNPTNTNSVDSRTAILFPSRR